jgi:CheY-like chemotaxis protein
LNGILGMLDVLDATTLTPEQQDCLNTIRKSGQHLVGIINSILDFSKVEAGALTLDNVPFNLLAEVNTVVASFQPEVPVQYVPKPSQSDLLCGLWLCALQARVKGVQLSLVVGEGLPVNLIGDPLRLRQVLLNIIGNALKFTDRGGCVVVSVKLDSTKSASDGVVGFKFSVSDTGLGIPSQHLPLLFKPFVQTEGSALVKMSGTGLGLTISKQLIAMMGGSIQVASVVGEGTTFFFSAQFALDKSQESKRAAPTIVASKLSAPPLPKTAQASSVAEAKAEAKASAITTTTTTTTTTTRAAKFATVADEAITPPSDPVKDRQRPAVLASTAASSAAASASAVVIIDNRPAVAQPSAVADDSAAKVKERTTVLVAEDNAVNQKVLCKLLELLGWRSQVACDGELAVKLFTAHPGRFGVILMDCQMPVKDGFEAAKEIRKFEASQQMAIQPTYIVAVTADVVADVKDRCRESGMNSFMSKPIDVQTLKETLSAFMQYRYSTS